MSGIRIRIADAQKDAAAVLDIYRPYIEQTAVTFEVDVPSRREFAARMEGVAGEFPYLLLEIGGELVGYAYAHQQAERAAFAWNAELSIYFKQGWQGRGLGRPLYALLMELLTLQGYINFYGVITTSNAGSITMHEKMGFAKIGHHEKTGYKLGEWHDTVWMHKRTGGDGAPGEIVRFDALDKKAVEERIASACRQIESRLGASCRSSPLQAK